MSPRRFGAVFVEQYREMRGEGYESKSDIAERLGMTRDAVDMQLRRARYRGDDLSPLRIGEGGSPELRGFTERDDLACREHDPELFFPATDPRSDTYAEQVETARQVCRTCPAYDACLRYALATNQVGVWAATTEEERRQMKGSAA